MGSCGPNWGLSVEASAQEAAAVSLRPSAEVQEEWEKQGEAAPHCPRANWTNGSQFGPVPKGIPCLGVLVHNVVLECALIC